MRILHIDTEMTWRGGENQLRLLLEGLSGSLAESHVALQPGSAAAERLAQLTPIITLPMRGGFAPLAALKLKAYCRAHDIDLIDAHTSNAHSLGLLIKALAPELKLVVHRRVDYAPGSGRLNRMKYMSAKVDRYVAISDAIASVLVEYGVPSSRISVVKSAIRTDGYRDGARPAAREELAKAYGIDPKMALIGNASALTSQKGHEVLLGAAKVLKDQGMPFHVFIAGEGELTNPLERLRIELGLEHHVTFMGFVKDVPRFLSGLDIMAVPSNFEGLGTIILEAIASGLPVAATRVGGIPEIITHNKTGLLSEVGDSAGLAANLAQLIRQPELRRQLNTAARTHVAAAFSVGAMVGGNLTVYREILGRLGV